MRYESSPKHRQPGGWRSLCPKAIDPRTAQALLSGSVAVGNKRYAVHDGRAYCAHEHGGDVWHGYPVGWVAVPESLRRAWLAEGRLQRQDMRKNWKSKKNWDSP